MRIKKNKQVIAGAIACALLVSGTLAWQSFSQIATNETNGIEADQGTRLHNYFDGSNADVFVENYARFETGATAYTRVKVLEYMEIGDTAGALTGRNESALTQVRGDVENTATPDINDKTTWDTYLHDSNEDATGEIRDYMSVSYGEATNSNQGQVVYMPTFNKDFESLDPEINGKLEGDTADRFTTDQYNDYVPYLLGETLTATATYSEDSSVAQAEGTTSIEETHEAVKTKSGSVITMDKWITDGKTTGDFWVYDVDGWAYWANGLAPETATSVLIDNVSKVKTPDEDWYYGLHVINDSATAYGWGEALGVMAEGEMTDSALELLMTIGEIEPVFIVYGMSLEMPEDASARMEVGNSVQLSAKVLTDSHLEEVQAFTWSIKEVNTTDTASIESRLSESEINEAFVNGKFTAISGMEGNFYTLTATPSYDPSKAASVNVEVYDPTDEPNLEPESEDLEGDGYLDYYDGAVSSVKIDTPSTTFVSVGSNLQLSATVTSTDQDKNGIVWFIEDTEAGGTLSQNQINNTFTGGMFTPVSGMEGRSYLITAQCTSNLSKIDTITLTVPDTNSEDTKIYISISGVGTAGDGLEVIYKESYPLSALVVGEVSQEVIWTVTDGLDSDIRTNSALGTYLYCYDYVVGTEIEVTATSAENSEIFSSVVVTVSQGYTLETQPEVELGEFGSISPGSTDTIEIDDLEFYVLCVGNVEVYNASGNSMGKQKAMHLLMKEPLESETASEYRLQFSDVAKEGYDITSWMNSTLRSNLAEDLKRFSTLYSNALNVETTVNGFTSGLPEISYDQWFPLTLTEMQSYNILGTEIAMDNAVISGSNMRWLRDANSATRVLAIGSEDGARSNTEATYSRAVRPALWYPLD